jgi:hypothetical protein
MTLTSHKRVLTPRQAKSADGREFQFADCAYSRPCLAEFAHRKSASWRGVLLTLPAHSSRTIDQKIVLPTAGFKVQLQIGSKYENKTIGWPRTRSAD